jgi:hypothetical protein
VHELAAKEQALGAGAKYSAEKLAVDPGKSVGNFPSKTRDHVGTVVEEMDKRSSVVSPFLLMPHSDQISRVPHVVIEHFYG